MADHTPLSASEEDHGLWRDTPPPPPAAEMPFAVPTTKGFQPFYPPPDSAPPDSPEQHRPENDNPLNPKGGPSLSLPQQATPLTSQQGTLSPEDMIDERRARDIAMTQDGLAPDNPAYPRGTPDYIVEGVTDPDADLIVQQISPTTAPVSNTPISLEIIGVGFQPDSVVSIDGTVSASTGYINQNRLTAEFIPDTAGIKQVSVDGAPPIPFEVTEEGIDA